MSISFFEIALLSLINGFWLAFWTVFNDRVFKKRMEDAFDKLENQIKKIKADSKS